MWTIIAFAAFDLLAGILTRSIALAAFGLLAGILTRSWWAIVVAPALVVLFTVIMTAIQTDVRDYGGTDWGPIMTALLFAFWPFIGAVVGVIVGKLIRSRARV